MHVHLYKYLYNMKLWEQYIVGAEVTHWFHTTLVIEVWLWKMKQSTNNTASAPFRRCIQIAVWCATASHQRNRCLPLRRRVCHSCLCLKTQVSQHDRGGDDLAMYSGCESDNRFSHWIDCFIKLYYCTMALGYSFPVCIGYIILML